MFGKAFVGVDGGPGGRDALTLARRLADAGSTITLAHVHPGERMPLRMSNLDFDAVERDEARAILERERASAGIADAPLLVIAAETVGEGLHRLAEEHGADLLVIGSHRRSAGGRVLVRDDTRAALNGAPCPVAIAPWGYAKAANGVATIGVGYDGSPESEVALEVARQLALGRQARIVAVTVVPIPDPYRHPQPTTLHESPDAALEAAQARLSALEGVEGRAVYGVPAEELAAFGGEADLLLVGSRAFGPVRRLIFGSTAQTLASRARCPLIVLSRSAKNLRPGDTERGEGSAQPPPNASPARVHDA